MLLAIGLVASYIFAPETRVFDFVSIKGSGQFLAAFSLGKKAWYDDAVIAADADSSETRHIKAYRFANLPSVQSNYAVCPSFCFLHSPLLFVHLLFVPVELAGT